MNWYQILWRLVKAFIETYQQQHPDDEVKHIDLFETYIPVSDKDVLTGWEK